MQREVVQPPGLGAPIGPYSHVFSVDLRSFSRLVFIAGQVAFDRQGNLVGQNDMRAQFGQVYANLQAAVEGAGGTMASIVSLRTLLTRAEDQAVFNECRTEQYPRIFPDGVYPPNTLFDYGPAGPFRPVAGARGRRRDLSDDAITRDPAGTSARCEWRR